ncbi:MAG: hypothetical protein K2W96_04180 [Gemmataceae bacterium]|nr:hypothetical protein [Gemmataceae bacterium]
MRKLVGTMALLAALCALVLPTRSPAQAKGEDVVKQVLDAWAKRRKAIKTARYRFKGTETYARGSLTMKKKSAHPSVRAIFPPEDSEFPLSGVFLADFTQARFRGEKTFSILMSSRGAFRRKHEVLFAVGEKSTVGEPREANTSQDYTPADTQPDVYKLGGPDGFLVDQELEPLLLAHGYPSQQGLTEAISTRVATAYDSSKWRHLSNQAHEGRSHVVVATVPDGSKDGFNDEYWVELAREGFISRWRLLLNGEVIVSADIVSQRVDGHWLPSGWRLDRFSVRGGGRQHYRSVEVRCEVAAIDQPIARSAFEAELKEGMVVYTDSGQYFSVGSDNTTLVPLGASTTIRTWTPWLIGLCVLAGLAGAWWYWRSRGRAISPAADPSVSG